ncbi:hypothetical protein C8J57DRAFT_1719337, partial [Mycena rebaudengoi]
VSLSLTTIFAAQSPPNLLFSPQPRPIKTIGTCPLILQASFAAGTGHHCAHGSALATGSGRDGRGSVRLCSFAYPPPGLWPPTGTVAIITVSSDIPKACSRSCTGAS